MGQVPEGLLEIRVNYGLGGSFTTRFDAQKIVDWNLAKILRDAVDRPRPPGSGEQSTAKVIGDLLKERREVDVELIEGSSDGTVVGRPITLGHVVIPSGETTSRKSQNDSITVQISESYRGGAGRGL